MTDQTKATVPSRPPSLLDLAQAYINDGVITVEQYHAWEAALKAYDTELRREQNRTEAINNSHREKL